MKHACCRDFPCLRVYGDGREFEKIHGILGCALWFCPADESCVCARDQMKQGIHDEYQYCNVVLISCFVGKRSIRWKRMRRRGNSGVWKSGLWPTENSRIQSTLVRSTVPYLRYFAECRRVCISCISCISSMRILHGPKAVSSRGACLSFEMNVEVADRHIINRPRRSSHVRSYCWRRSLRTVSGQMNEFVREFLMAFQQIVELLFGRAIVRRGN